MLRAFRPAVAATDFREETAAMCCRQATSKINMDLRVDVLSLALSCPQFSRKKISRAIRGAVCIITWPHHVQVIS